MTDADNSSTTTLRRLWPFAKAIGHALFAVAWAYGSIRILGMHDAVPLLLALLFFEVSYDV